MADWPDDPTTPSPTEVNVTEGPDAAPQPERGEGGVQAPETRRLADKVLSVVGKYHPRHYRAWADKIREKQGYASILTELLDDLADALTDCEPGEGHGLGPETEYKARHRGPDGEWGDWEPADPTLQRSEGEDWWRCPSCRKWTHPMHKVRCPCGYERHAEGEYPAIDVHAGWLEHFVRHEEWEAAKDEAALLREALDDKYGKSPAEDFDGLRASEDHEPRGGGGDG